MRPIRHLIVLVIVVVAACGKDSARPEDPRSKPAAPPESPATARSDPSDNPPAESWPEDGAWCEVVSPGGRPLPGAVVYWCPQREPRVATVCRLDREGRSLEAAIRAIGRRFPCDESGRVRLPAAPATFVAAAWKGLWGTNGPYPDSKSYRLILHPVVLTIAVTDSSDQPCVRVPIRIVGAGGEGGDLYRTAADGSLRVRGGAAWADKPSTVQFAWPLPPGKKMRIEPADLPKTVSLKLPECGRLRVRVRDARGNVPELGLSIHLKEAGTETRLWEGGFADYWLPEDTTSIRVVDGERVFPYVGLGQQIEVVARSERHPQAIRAVRGPTKPGEEIVVDHRLGQPWPVIVGRLLDEDGRPLAGVDYEADMLDDRYTQTESTTDENGRFRHVLRSGEPDLERPRLHLSLTRPGEAHLFVLPVPRGIRDRHDVGDLRLRPDRMVVSGRAVGSDGKPVPEAQVVVHAAGGESERWTRGWCLLWPEAYVWSDEDGRFTVTGGFEKSREVVVRVEGDEVSKRRLLQRRPVQCLRGTRGLNVVLEEVATVRATLLVNDHFRDLEPWARLRRCETDGDPFDAKLTALDDGRFEAEWDRVLTGTYTLDLGVKHHPKPLVSIPDIRIRAGQPLDDARLTDIDLRSRLKTARVLVRVGPRAFQEVWGWWHSSSEKEPIVVHKSSFGSDPLAIPVPIVEGRPVDMFVAAPHLRYQKVSGVTGDRTVTLREELRLRIVVDGIPAGDRPILYCTPAHTNPHPGPFALYGWGFENGVATVWANFPGPYDVRVSLEKAGVTVPTRPAVIEVNGTDGQAFRLAFDRQAYAKALREKPQEEK